MGVLFSALVLACSKCELKLMISSLLAGESVTLDITVPAVG